MSTTTTVFDGYVIKTSERYEDYMVTYNGIAIMKTTATYFSIPQTRGTHHLKIEHDNLGTTFHVYLDERRLTCIGLNISRDNNRPAHVEITITTIADEYEEQTSKSERAGLRLLE